MEVTMKGGRRGGGGKKSVPVKGTSPRVPDTTKVGNLKFNAGDTGRAKDLARDKRKTKRSNP
jgi:hypothetical protein